MDTIYRNSLTQRNSNLALCFAGVMVQISFFVVYLMGNLTTWRTAAAISACLPVITALYVTQVRGILRRERPRKVPYSTRLHRAQSSLTLWQFLITSSNSQDFVQPEVSWTHHVHQTPSLIIIPGQESIPRLPIPNIHFKWLFITKKCT
jgi:hypothetical protein